VDAVSVLAVVVVLTNTETALDVLLAKVVDPP